MNTTAQRRLARFTGLVLLSLLVVAVGVQVAQAAASSTTPAATWEGRGGVTALATTPAATWEGRGGVTAVRGVTAAQPSLPGTPSTASWIIAGSALAVFTIGLATWALIRRRRQRDEPLSVAFCAQHPEHAMCGAA